MLKRIGMLPTHDLVAFIDTTVSQVGKDVYDAQRGSDDVQAAGCLAEAEAGAEALLEMVRELRSRVGA